MGNRNDSVLKRVVYADMEVLNYCLWTRSHGSILTPFAI